MLVGVTTPTAMFLEQWEVSVVGDNGDSYFTVDLEPLRAFSPLAAGNDWGHTSVVAATTCWSRKIVEVYKRVLRVYEVRVNGGEVEERYVCFREEDETLVCCVEQSVSY